MADAITEVKRAQEVSDRPGKTAPTPVPSELRATTNPEPSYKAAHEARTDSKSEMEKSLDWNAQQRKVAEGQ